MALFKFTRAILNDEPIDIYNNGDLSRDFTYVDDITKAIELLIDKTPKPSEQSPVAPYRVVNIGNSDPVKLMDFIETLEDVLGKKAIRNFLPMQAGDVHATWANTDVLFNLTGYRAKTDLKSGIGSFVEWYLKHNSEG